MSGVIATITSWQALGMYLVVCALFGFVPGVVLRATVRMYPRSNPRRRELLAELRTIPRPKRPVWVFEQIETALFDGLLPRLHAAFSGMDRVCQLLCVAATLVEPGLVIALYRDPFGEGHRGIVVAGMLSIGGVIGGWLIALRPSGCSLCAAERIESFVMLGTGLSMLPLVIERIEYWSAGYRSDEWACLIPFVYAAGGIVFGVFEIATPRLAHRRHS